MRATLQRGLAWIDSHAERLLGIAVGAIFAVGSLYSIQLGSELPYWDEREYHQLATGLVERGEYELMGQRAFRPPLYPFLLAGLLELGAPIAALRMANFALLAACAALLYTLVRRYSGSRAGGLLAAVWIFAYPVLIYAAGKLYPQTLAGFLLLLCLVLMLRDEPPRVGRAVATGVLYGLLVLTVPTFLPLLGVLLLWSLWQAGRRALAPALIVGAAALAVLAPWTMRNYLVLGRAVPVATNSGINLLLGNSENTRPELGTNVDLESYHRRAEGLGELEQDRFYREQALAWMKENPGEAVVLYLGKLGQYFAYEETLATASEGSRLRTLLMAVTYLPLLAIAFGQFLWWKRRPHPVAWALAALYLANAVLMAVFFTRIRFRLPFDLLLLALAGGAIGQLLARTAYVSPRVVTPASSDR